VPVMVPTIPFVSDGTDGSAVVNGDPTPTQAGTTSRIGTRVGAFPPTGFALIFTAWGLRAGAAPPGTSTLTVLASGSTFVRGFCYSVGGYARAYADVFVKVEEFEPTHKPVAHSGSSIDTHDPGIEHAEIAPTPDTMLGTFRLTQTIRGPKVIVIDQETTVLGVQSVSMDADPEVPGLFMPITPGNFYRVWIESAQQVEAELNGDAVSNIAFDFGPVFFAFR
jgi:hypothetical protein